MKKFISLCLLFSLMLTACSTSDNKSASTEIITLNVESAIENIGSVKLSKYASSINYIPLEATDESLLGKVVDFKVDDGQIYVASQDGNSIICFSGDGSFKQTIGTRGRGPGEHLGILKLFLAHNNAIGAMSITKSVVYDKEGRLITELADFGKTGVKRAGNIMMYDKENYVLTYTYLDSASMQQNEEIKIIDQTGRVLSSYSLSAIYKKPTKYMQFGGLPMPRPKSSVLYRYDTNIRFINGRYDTIFTYIPDVPQKKESYVIDYGKYYTLTFETLEFGARIDSPDNVLIAETDDLLCFNMILPAQNWPDFNESTGEYNAIFIYDKNDKSFTLLEPDKEDMISAFVNDLDGGMAFSPSYIQDNVMYQVVDAISFIELANSSKSAQMKRVAGMLTDESNPVVIAVTLK